MGVLYRVVVRLSSPPRVFQFPEKIFHKKTNNEDQEGHERKEDDERGQGGDDGFDVVVHGGIVPERGADVKGKERNKFLC
jgi:hypothetical protein